MSVTCLTETARRAFTLAVILPADNASFIQAGYQGPSWRLPLNGRPLLERVLFEVGKVCEPSRVVIVADRRDMAHGVHLVASAMAPAFPNISVCWLDASVSALDRAIHAAVSLKGGEAALPFFIHSFDGLRRGCDLGSVAARLAGGQAAWVDVLGADSLPKTEARPLDQHTLFGAVPTGLYGFPSAADFVRRCAALGGDRAVGTVRGLLTAMLNKGTAIIFDSGNPGAPDRPVFFSTPEAYEASIRREAEAGALVLARAAPTDIEGLLARKDR